MDSIQAITDDNRDNNVDDEIIRCLNLKNPRSFFMFAGAGSGKTRSLENTLKSLKKTVGYEMLNKSQQIAIITYTNAACEEILRRIGYHPLFAISTIHSFSWELIRPYSVDIREWLKNESVNKIKELEEKQSTGRVGTKAYNDRIKEIEKHTKRLDYLDSIKKFTYNPNGENTSRESLNHSEVIKLSSDFISAKPMLQDILINKFPIFLIDESQDTKADLIDALIQVQHNKPNCFAIGLFGDTMQRIYLDGKEKLNEIIPNNWSKPCKTMNHRSQNRIVSLINDIRFDIDGQKQKSRADKNGGFVHLFITNSDNDKFAIENAVRHSMSNITNDILWNEIDKCKCLTIEHHMASKRLKFDHFFNPLYSINSFKTGLLDGTLSGVNFFINYILPLVNANKKNNHFEVARIIRTFSPIFKEGIKNKDLSVTEIQQAKQHTKDLFSLWRETEPTCLEILKCVAKSGLFEIPNSLYAIALRNVEEQVIAESSGESATEEAHDSDENKIDAWDEALKASFSEVERYYQYIQGKASFDTHQGVKGLEFPRVMVVIDDDESRGNTFNYNKLFGVTAKSETDIRNEQQGKDTTIDRTKRLFYVVCSRAEESLAIIYYTHSVPSAKESILRSGWFFENEITIL